MSQYRLGDLTPDDLSAIMEEAVRRVLRGELPAAVREVLRGELASSPRSGLVTVGELAGELGVHRTTVSPRVARLPRFDSLGAPDPGGRYLRRAEVVALHLAPKPRPRRPMRRTA